MVGLDRRLAFRLPKLPQCAELLAIAGAEVDISGSIAHNGRAVEDFLTAPVHHPAMGRGARPIGMGLHKECSATAFRLAGFLSTLSSDISSAKSIRGCAIAYEAKIAGAASREAACQRVAQLEPNERRALERIVDGYSLVKIAGDLGVDLEEAVRLKAFLLRKLGAMTTADLVRIGLYAQDA